jgi:hypothetical protein
LWLPGSASAQALSALHLSDYVGTYTDAPGHTGGVAVVGRLIENVVHTPLPEFAQANLFAPLGISRAQWQWNYDLTNADKEYSQIHLRPRDNLVAVFTAGGYNAESTPPNTIMAKIILPALMAAHPHDKR